MLRRGLSRKFMGKPLETPGCDQREYGQVMLGNKIIATLISDKTLTRSSCALAVDVGASDDPVEYPGLAHFTEHMLFLGTEKYPRENYYKQFLNTHGGSSNASTSMEATVYRFDVNSTHFPEALDIFSQFFKNPLFSSDSTSREIKAVDAEDSKNRQLDGRRTLQILKCLVNPSHPYRKYSTGNILTLARGDPDRNGQLIREKMKAFYQKYYLSRKMGVSLAGPQSIRELEALAQLYFSDVLHNPSASEGSSVSESSCEGLLEVGQTVFINPVKELNELNIFWVLPSLRCVDCPNLF
jgi:insulysin